MALLPKWYFGDYTFATPRSMYAGSVNPQLDTTLSNLDTKFRTNLSNYNELQSTINNLALQVRENNSPVIKAALERAKADLAAYESGAGNLSNQYEFATMDVNKAVRGFDDDMLVKGALQDYEQQQAYLANLQTLKAEGKLNDTDYNKAVQHSQRLNTAPVEFDKDTYSFKNVWSGYDPVESVNLPQMAMEIQENWKASSTPFALADGREVLYTIKDGVPGYYTTIDSEYVSEDEVLNGIMMYLKEDPKVQAWTEQQLMWDKLNDAEREGKGYKLDAQGNYIFTPRDYKQAIIDNHGDALSYYGIKPEDLDSYGGDMEGLYNQIKTNEYYRKAALPAAMKASYTKQTADHTKDWMNELALQDYYKGQEQARNFAYQKEMKTWEYQQQNPQYYSTVQSQLTADENYNIADRTKALSQLKIESDRLKGLIDNNDATFEEEMQYDIIQDQIRVQSGLDDLAIEKYLANNKTAKDKITTLYEKTKEEYIKSKELSDKGVKTIKTDKFSLFTEDDLKDEASFIRALTEKSEMLEPSFKKSEDRMYGFGRLESNIDYFLRRNLGGSLFGTLTSQEALYDLSKELINDINTYAKENKLSKSYNVTPITDATQLSYLDATMQASGKVADITTVSTTPKTIEQYRVEYPEAYYDTKWATVQGEPDMFQATFELKRDGDKLYIDDSGDYVTGKGKSKEVLISKRDLVKQKEVLFKNYNNTANASLNEQYAVENAYQAMPAKTQDGTRAFYTNLDEYDVWDGITGNKAVYEGNRNAAADLVIGTQLKPLTDKVVNKTVVPATTVKADGTVDLNVDAYDMTDVKTVYNNGTPYSVIPVKVKNDTRYMVIQHGQGDNAVIIGDSEGKPQIFNSVKEVGVEIYKLGNPYTGADLSGKQLIKNTTTSGSKTYYGN